MDTYSTRRRRNERVLPCVNGRDTLEDLRFLPRNAHGGLSCESATLSHTGAEDNDKCRHSVSCSTLLQPLLPSLLLLCRATRACL